MSVSGSEKRFCGNLVACDDVVRQACFRVESASHGQGLVVHISGNTQDDGAPVIDFGVALASDLNTCRVEYNGYAGELMANRGHTDDEQDIGMILFKGTIQNGTNEPFSSKFTVTTRSSGGSGFANMHLTYETHDFSINFVGNTSDESDDLENIEFISGTIDDTHFEASCGEYI